MLLAIPSLGTGAFITWVAAPPSSSYALLVPELLSLGPHQFNHPLCIANGSMPQPDLTSELQTPVSSFSSLQLSHPRLLCYLTELQQHPLLTLVPFLQPTLMEQENEDNKMPVKKTHLP